MVISLSPDFQGYAVFKGGEITGKVDFWVVFSDQNDYSDVAGWTTHRLARQVAWGRQAGHDSDEFWLHVLRQVAQVFMLSVSLFFFFKGGRWDIVEIPFKSNFWGKFLAEWDIFETYDPFTSRCTKKSSHTLCRQISLSPSIWSYEEPSFRSLRKTLDITITLQLELWLNVVWRPEKQHYILCLLF